MTSAALLMMVIGLGVTWGGALVCMSLALKKRNT